MREGARVGGDFKKKERKKGKGDTFVEYMDLLGVKYQREGTRGSKPLALAKFSKKNLRLHSCCQY